MLTYLFNIFYSTWSSASENLYDGQLPWCTAFKCSNFHGQLDLFPKHRLFTLHWPCMRLHWHSVKLVTGTTAQSVLKDLRLEYVSMSGLPIWVSVLSTGLVTTFYTALGGIRAVVWTDVVQLVFLTTGLLTVVSVGMVKVGGMERLWSVAYKGLRVQSFDIDPNPFKRHTVWSLMIGGAGMVLSIYATNQTQVQRYLACRDLRTAQLSILLNIPLNALFLFVQLLSGLVSYVYFVGCDPISSGSVSKSDQILPYIVMVLFDGIPVIRGLFLSVIFAAAISTVSSGVNSLATVLLEDIFRPLLLFVRKRDITERKRSLLAVILSIIVGVCTIGMSFVFMVMGPRVLQFSFSLFGAVGGPILAVFTLGMVIPCVNWQVSISLKQMVV
ncbi:solute carrier family 5 (sodium-dependent multivitamin transporter), member 6 [Paragonimus westermani]|uniref:Solute carrier family 5 (Sodium-dependent multivitamin transporter), member 6 n=1 Tax=Paragonimus westermani TaxID=34504 RepID=A0A5J4NXP9_9TREM|nr:solute carrier family 5 (sodium-dependent multivitamin transporter), member 6 [Paragonimus westermani]